MTGNLPPLMAQWWATEAPGDPTLNRTLANWLRGLAARMNDTPNATRRVSLTDQEAAVALSSLVPAPSAGVYRVSWYLRITRAATVSSSVAVTIRSTDGGVVCSQGGAAVVGNTTATVQSGVVLVRADASAPISFETAYGSVGATAMQYRLDLVVESL